MTSEKGRVLQWLRQVSAGTVANMIGSCKYAVIDSTLSKAALLASAMDDEQLKAIQTMADYETLLRSAMSMK